MGLEFEAALAPLAAEPAGRRLQRQGLQFGAERGVDVREHDIGSRCRQLALHHVDPGAQCAAPLRHLDAQVGVTAKLRNIDPLEIGKDLAVPFLPQRPMQRQQRLAKLSPQREAIPPFRRWCRVQPHCVAPGRIAHHQVDFAQCQRRRGAKLVGPAHRSAADEKFGLAEKPVGGAAVPLVRLRKVEACDVDMAIGGTPDVDFGLVDHELVEPQVPQRPGCQCRDDPRQPERLAALRVHQHHVGQLERRDQTAAARSHAADAHGHAKHPSGLDFQVGAKLADSGHNPAMERSPRECKHQPRGGQQPQNPLRDGGGCLQQT